MSVDLDKMKEKLDRVQNGGSSSSNNIFWKPEKNATQTIRLLLPEDGTGDPFKEYWLHYNLDGPNFLCPDKTYGEDCPVCDFGWDMYEKGKEMDSSEHLDLGKDLLPDRRFYSAVIERDEDGGVKEGPSWYGYSKTVFEAFMGYMLDPDYDDFTDPDEGRDVKLTYTQGESDPFPSTEIKLKPTKSPLHEDEEKREELIENIPDIKEGLTELNKEEIKEELEEYMDNNYRTEGKEMEKYGEGGDEKDEVEEAFEELAE